MSELYVLLREFFLPFFRSIFPLISTLKIEIIGDIVFF